MRFIGTSRQTDEYLNAVTSFELINPSYGGVLCLKITKVETLQLAAGRFHRLFHISA